MTPETLAAVVLAWMISLAPPARYATAEEPPDAREVRYEAIAADISAAALEDPAPRRAAALLTAVSFLESGWAPDVDGPVCAPARVARGGCDHGRARTIFQLQGVHPATRLEAAQAALAAIRRSERACGHLAPEYRLAVFAAGTCHRGFEASRVRVALAKRLEAR